MKPNETEQHDILELLHQRRKRSSTIFCSQYEPAGWYDQLGGDESPLAEAILATARLRDFILWDGGSAAFIKYRFPNTGLPVSNLPDRRFHRTGIIREENCNK
ncbi:MAG: hypothetical protein SPL86_06325 [Succiniclasticum sp.]|nr:hypothetical protein [Succiniclasticum sp.]MDY6291081.1 hypothetical protein [Succiniclasticum sp.]